jgi:hypothetical protein
MTTSLSDRVRQCLVDNDDEKALTLVADAMSSATNEIELQYALDVLDALLRTINAFSGGINKVKGPTLN